MLNRHHRSFKLIAKTGRGCFRIIDKTNISIVGSTHDVYYSSDTGMFDGFAEIGRRLGPFDVALIETGAYDQLWPDVHLGPEQAVQVAKDVAGRLLIPVHWGTFNLALHSWTEPIERVIAAARSSSISIAVAKPGQRINPDRPPDVKEVVAQHPVANRRGVSTGIDRTIKKKRTMKGGRNESVWMVPSIF